MKKSSIKHKTAHAVWSDEKFKFLVTDCMAQVINVTIFDHDQFSKNEALGRCEPSSCRLFPPLHLRPTRSVKEERQKVREGGGLRVHGKMRGREGVWGGRGRGTEVV